MTLICEKSGYLKGTHGEGPVPDPVPVSVLTVLAGILTSRLKKIKVSTGVINPARPCPTFSLPPPAPTNPTGCLLLASVPGQDPAGIAMPLHMAQVLGASLNSVNGLLCLPPYGTVLELGVVVLCEILNEYGKNA